MGVCLCGVTRCGRFRGDLPIPHDRKTRSSRLIAENTWEVLRGLPKPRTWIMTYMAGFMTRHSRRSGGLLPDPMGPLRSHYPEHPMFLSILFLKCCCSFCHAVQILQCLASQTIQFFTSTVYKNIQRSKRTPAVCLLRVIAILQCALQNETSKGRSLPFCGLVKAVMPVFWSCTLVALWIVLWATHDLPSRAPVYRGCPCRDPPVCLYAQRGIKAKRQPFFCGCWSVVLSMPLVYASKHVQSDCTLLLLYVFHV